MDFEHALIYIHSDAGDMATREIAWDLLARGMVRRATYLEGAELFLTDSGKGKLSHGLRTLAVLCEVSQVEKILAHLDFGVQAVAVPVLRAKLP